MFAPAVLVAPIPRGRQPQDEFEIGHLVHRLDVEPELAGVAGVHGIARVESRQASDRIEVPAEDINTDGEDGRFGRLVDGDAEVERLPTTADRGVSTVSQSA